MAGDDRAWNTTTNRLLAFTLARVARLRFRGFVPKDTYRRSELESSIELVEDEKMQGNLPSDLLNFLADSANMDWKQFTLKSCVGTTAHWAKCIVDADADVVIMPSRFEGFGLSGLYAIFASVPVLVSKNSKLGMTLKMLPSGAKYVVESDDPEVWANKIKAVRAKDPTLRALEAEQLRNEYMDKFKWEDQCNELVEKMITKHGNY